MHRPMKVSRIETQNGSQVIPELDQAWDNLTRLRWKAGIAALDTGLPIHLDHADIRADREGPSLRGFVVQVGTLSTALDFDEAWHYLEGIRVGVEQMGAIHGRKAQPDKESPSATWREISLWNDGYRAGLCEGADR